MLSLSNNLNASLSHANVVEFYGVEEACVHGSETDEFCSQIGLCWRGDSSVAGGGRRLSRGGRHAPGVFVRTSSGATAADAADAAVLSPDLLLLGQGPLLISLNRRHDRRPSPTATAASPLLARLGQPSRPLPANELRHLQCSLRRPRLAFPCSANDRAPCQTTEPRSNALLGVFNALAPRKTPPLLAI